jgi:glycosyltransferase involved in cell wall biosynthesis
MSRRRPLKGRDEPATPVNIWLVYCLFAPYSGGAASDADLILRALSEREEIDRVFLVTEYHASRVKKTEGKVTVLSILPRRDSLPGWGLIYSAVSFVVTQLILVTLMIWIGLFRRRDILHFHSRLVYPWTALLVRLLRLRALVDVRDNFFKHASMPAFAAVLYVSQRIGECLARIVAPERPIYFPVPIDEEQIFAYARNGSAPKPLSPYLLYVGILHESKGVPELIAAYQSYRAAHRERSLELLLIGRNHLKHPIDLAAFPGVRLCGELSAEETYRFIARAERVILPSKSEGMPRICLEAIVLRVPVICPPGVAEFDVHCPRNVLPEVTAEAIRKMLEIPRENLFVNGYPMGCHDWKSTGMPLFSVYKRLYDSSASDLFRRSD